MGIFVNNNSSEFLYFVTPSDFLKLPYLNLGIVILPSPIYLASFNFKKLDIFLLHKKKLNINIFHFFLLFLYLISLILLLFTTINGYFKSLFLVSYNIN